MKIIILVLILVILLFILDLGNIKQMECLTKGPQGLQGSIGKVGIPGPQGPPGTFTPVSYPLGKDINEKIATKVMTNWLSSTNRAPDGMCSSIDGDFPVWSSITNTCVVKPKNHKTCASLYSDRLFWNGTNCIKPSSTDHCRSISGNTKVLDGTSCVPPTTDALCKEMDTEKPTWSNLNKYCVAKPKNDSTCAALSSKKPLWDGKSCIAPKDDTTCKKISSDYSWDSTEKRCYTSDMRGKIGVGGIQGKQGPIGPPGKVGPINGAVYDNNKNKKGKEDERVGYFVYEDLEKSLNKEPHAPWEANESGVICPTGGIECCGKFSGSDGEWCKKGYNAPTDTRPVPHKGFTGFNSDNGWCNEAFKDIISSVSNYKSKIACKKGKGWSEGYTTQISGVPSDNIKINSQGACNTVARSLETVGNEGATVNQDATSTPNGCWVNSQNNQLYFNNDKKTNNAFTKGMPCGTGTNTCIVKTTGGIQAPAIAPPPAPIAIPSAPAKAAP